MGYKGTTLSIPCTGGLNTTYNIEAVPPGALAISKNINLHNGGYEPRGGTIIYHGTAITGNARVVGGFHYNVGATSEIVAATSTLTPNKDIIYTVNTTGVDKTLYTATNAVTKKYSFVLYSYKCYIANGYDTIQVYTGGATTAALAAPHADWGANDQPIQLIKHGSGNSERLWAIAPTGTPGFFYYSNDNDGSSEASFTATGSGRIYIDTGDKYGLVGAIEYQDRLVLFGKRNTFILDDLSTDPNEWGYNQAGWTGGAAHFRVVVATENDAYCMTDDMEIYSFTAAQKYGDYQSASITRPAGIHTWIKDNINPAYINDFHAIYDPQMKAVKWFLVRNGQTQVDTCLVFYTDRPVEQAWTLHDNTTSNVNGYNAASSFYVKESDGRNKVYTGDWGGTAKGFISKTEQSAYSDNDTAYEVKLRTPRIAVGGEDGISDPRRNKRFHALMIVDQNFLNATSFSLTIYIDGVQHATTYSFVEPAHGFTLGTSILDIGVLTDSRTEYIEYVAEIGNFGKRIEFEISNNNVNKYFFIASMLLDYRSQSVKV